MTTHRDTVLWLLDQISASMDAGVEMAEMHGTAEQEKTARDLYQQAVKLRNDYFAYVYPEHAHWLLRMTPIE